MSAFKRDHASFDRESVNYYKSKLKIKYSDNKTKCSSICSYIDKLVFCLEKKQKEVLEIEELLSMGTFGYKEYVKDERFYGYKPNQYDNYFSSKLSARFKKEYCHINNIISIRKSLKLALNSPIKNSKIFNFHYGLFDKPKLATFSDFNDIGESFSDLVAPLYLSLLNSINQNDIIKTEDNKFYLNLGNGILAKIIYRKNTMPEYVEPLVAIMRKPDGFTFEKSIFCGYTNSGFILQHGLYIVTKEDIFEIYFDANAVLTGSTFPQHQQSISDSALIEEERREEEDWE